MLSVLICNQLKYKVITNKTKKCLIIRCYKLNKTHKKNPPEFRRVFKFQYSWSEIISEEALHQLHELRHCYL